MSWVKKFCNDYCMNENQISKRSGISRSSLNSSKKNNNSIKSCKAENLHKLSKVTGATMDELYRWYK